MSLRSPATASRHPRLPRLDPLGRRSRPVRAGIWPRIIYAYLPALGLIGYLVILLVRYWWLSDWRDLRESRETGAALGFQALGFAVFSISVLPLLFRNLRDNEFIILNTPRGIFVAFFFAMALVFPVLGGEPSVRAAAYALLTWSLFISAAAFWSTDYLTAKRALGWAGMLILAFLLLLLIKHGLTAPGTARRAVGGIQPNQFGQAALVAMVLTFMLPRWLTYPAVATALVLMALVTSRSQLLGATVFLLGYAVLTLRATTSSPALMRLATAVLALTTGAMAVEMYLLYERGASLLVLLADKVLLLDDPTRGLGSGFTGRTDLWLSGLQAVAERPFFGYGFRSAVERAHSGYISLILDVGIPLAVWFVVFAIVEVGRRIAAVRSLRANSLEIPENRDLSLLHKVIGAYLVAILVTWIFEPNYLNLGTLSTVLSILFLAAPYSDSALANNRAA